jgi:hypothetical protein
MGGGTPWPVRLFLDLPFLVHTTLPVSFTAFLIALEPFHQVRLME